MNGFWSRLYSTPLGNEPLVGRIHLIEALEGLARYSARDTRTYFPRIRESLTQLPEQYRHAALLVFCSVLYYPTTILDDIWRYLFFELKRLRESDVSEADFMAGLHFFEIDPTGMTAHFAHLNSIPGRLDTRTTPRAGHIADCVQLVRNLSNADPALQAESTDELRLLAQKKTWAILTDKALSGQSLANDLRRFMDLASCFTEITGAPIRIVVLAQIMTAEAREHANTECDLVNHPFVTLIGGSEIDSSCKVNSPSCRLFGTPEELSDVRRLCEWFAQTYLDPDSDLTRMREKSGDNLAFGYRGSGLTICDSANCPTNSLPILWYESDKGKPSAYVPPYRGPYPRTHSRIGDQSRSPLGSKLEEVPAWRDTLLKILKPCS